MHFRIEPAKPGPQHQQPRLGDDPLLAQLPGHGRKWIPAPDLDLRNRRMAMIRGPQESGHVTENEESDEQKETPGNQEASTTGKQGLQHRQLSVTFTFIHPSICFRKPENGSFFEEAAK